MANPEHVFPDAVWAPYPGKHGNRPRINPNTFIHHSTASANTWGVHQFFSSASTQADSTYILPASTDDTPQGRPIQGLLIVERSWANLDGNGYAGTCECVNTLDHGDPTTDAGFNADLLTESQLYWLPLMIEWQHEKYGLALDDVEYPGESGVAWHRKFPQWGSTACPGDARLRQIQTIIIPNLGKTPSTQGDIDMALDQNYFDAKFKALEDKVIGDQHAETNRAVGFLTDVLKQLKSSDEKTRNDMAAWTAKIADMKGDEVKKELDELEKAIKAGLTGPIK